MDEAVIHENGRLRSLVLLGDRAITFKSQSIACTMPPPQLKAWL
jgi:hypothetical protein